MAKAIYAPIMLKCMLLNGAVPDLQIIVGQIACKKVVQEPRAEKTDESKRRYGIALTIHSSAELVDQEIEEAEGQRVFGKLLRRQNG